MHQRTRLHLVKLRRPSAGDPVSPPSSCSVPTADRHDHLGEHLSIILYLLLHLHERHNRWDRLY
jgi:hypothetical protein